MISLSACTSRAAISWSRARTSYALRWSSIPLPTRRRAAEQTSLKGLAAAGWHMAAIAMRLAVEARPFGLHPLGIGMDDLRRLAPVRPVDTLHPEDEVIVLKPL